MAEVKIKVDSEIKVKVGTEEKAKVGITNSIVEVAPYEIYQGEYTFFATTNKDLVIPTKLKELQDNITIKKIKTEEKMNENGVEFHIGG